MVNYSKEFLDTLKFDTEEHEVDKGVIDYINDSSNELLKQYLSLYETKFENPDKSMSWCALEHEFVYNGIKNEKFLLFVKNYSLYFKRVAERMPELSPEQDGDIPLKALIQFGVFEQDNLHVLLNHIKTVGELHDLLMQAASLKDIKGVGDKTVATVREVVRKIFPEEVYSQYECLKEEEPVEKVEEPEKLVLSPEEVAKIVDFLSATEQLSTKPLDSKPLSSEEVMWLNELPSKSVERLFRLLVSYGDITVGQLMATNTEIIYQLSKLKEDLQMIRGLLWVYRSRTLDKSLPIKERLDAFPNLSPETLVHLGILPSRLLNQLHRQVYYSGKPVTPPNILKFIKKHPKISRLHGISDQNLHLYQSGIDTYFGGEFVLT